jgi:hypothetical protein
MLTLRVPDTGWARCPRCDERLGPVRYFRDDYEASYDDEGIDGIDRIIDSRGSSRPRYAKALALPVGWEQDAEGRWTLRPRRAALVKAGRTGIRSGRLPKMLGEPGIESLRDAGFLVEVNDVLICPKCHAPMRVAGTTYTGEHYLVRLTDPT